MSRTAIELNHVTFSYDQQPVLRDVSLQIEEGEFVAVLGSNGKGKSTLVKIMLGLLAPQAGSVHVLDHDARQSFPHERVAYVPQKATAFNNAFPATVREVVQSGFYHERKRLCPLTEAQRVQMRQTIDTVGLSGLEKRLIGHLSGGQQQRVFLARALVSKAALFFLDEPTSGIDAPSAASFCCLLADQNKTRGVTIVMITHDLDLICAHADKIIWLAPDQTLKIMTPQTYMASNETRTMHF